MLLVDDILLFPYRGLMWIFKEIHEMADEELAGEADRIREALTDLYMMLETGELSEEEFDRQETLLLDRLDALEAAQDMEDGGGEWDEEEPPDQGGAEEPPDGGDDP